ncbi:MAG TPA: FAD-binding protein, partial [Deltaproteobacteria bacterium]|nr:FAD-binding protein [Deltaproteobacteria bacterium]
MKNITVFLCTCFDEINRVVDYNRLRSHLSDDPRVAAVMVARGLCGSGGAEEIAASVKDGDDGRVLVAACSPLGRGDQLMRDLDRLGVPPFRRQLVDLREGCAWIHANNAAAATEKALDLLNMGLTALEHKEPSEDVTVKIAREVLVVGAGPAGMAAATALARCGIDVRVLERGAQPGGMLGLVSRSYPDNADPSEKIAAFRDMAVSDPHITFHPRAKIMSARGYAGNFTVRFTTDGEELQVNAGAVIIATGGRGFPPKGYYRYGEIQEIVSQIELEARFRKGPVKKENALFIQ